ncbi:HAD family hydrolase, partial [Paenibacillus sepulcri]|nr:HAD family hydrolase [Paenibacillus sepulcri]
CAYVLWDGKVVPFTSTLKQKVTDAGEAMALSAMRVLGFAYRDLRPQDATEVEDDVECQLIFVGLSGMIDPPRREVREAIATCRRAGIKTVMITGDHQLTAEAIAGQLGIMPRGGLSISGQQL